MKVSSIDLNLLVVLHAMLEDPSVARTAKRLHVTSPAISNALARARTIFDDPLFVRSGRGVVPTPRALELAPSLARAIGELERIVGDETRDPATTTRQLTLALDDTNQLARLPALVSAFTSRMPRSRLEVISVDTLVARGGLEAGAADAAIAPKEAASGLRSSALFEEEAVLVVRKRHPILAKRVTAKALGELRFVDIHLALGSGGVGHRMAKDHFGRAGLTRDVAVIVPTFAAAAMTAAKTNLVAGVPRRLIDVLEKSAPLVALDLDRLGPPRLSFEMHLVWHDRTDRDPICAFFRELVIDVLVTSRASATPRRLS